MKPRKPPSRLPSARLLSWKRSARWATACGWRPDVAVQPRGQQPETGLQWLEEELREAKARLHKVEHELDQALKQVWSLDADLRKLAETHLASGTSLAALPGLKEELRQLRDQISRGQDRQ